MHRISAISLAIFYLMISLGVSVNIHYCNDQVRSIQLYASPGPCCCTGSLDKDCCSYESVWIQLDNDNQIKPGILLVKDFVDFAVMTTMIGSEERRSNYATGRGVYSYLPPPERTPLWLLHCSLTYYG